MDEDYLVPSPIERIIAQKRATIAVSDTAWESFCNAFDGFFPSVERGKPGADERQGLRSLFVRCFAHDNLEALHLETCTGRKCLRSEIVKNAVQRVTGLDHEEGGENDVDLDVNANDNYEGGPSAARGRRGEIYSKPLLDGGLGDLRTIVKEALNNSSKDGTGYRLDVVAVLMECLADSGIGDLCIGKSGQKSLWGSFNDRGVPTWFYKHHVQEDHHREVIR